MSSLDERGRCCGRKPIVYKRPLRHFCPRCCRQFDADGAWQANWAWKLTPAGFEPTYPSQSYAALQPQGPKG